MARGRSSAKYLQWVVREGRARRERGGVSVSRQHKTSTLSGERGREAEREYLCCFWVIDMKGCADAKADQGQRTARAA